MNQDDLTVALDQNSNNQIKLHLKDSEQKVSGADSVSNACGADMLIIYISNNF